MTELSLVLKFLMSNLPLLELLYQAIVMHNVSQDVLTIAIETAMKDAADLEMKKELGA